MHATTQSIRILNSKILFPRFSDIVDRKRLHPLFSDIGKTKVTTVVAGAGYGKTTLIAQAWLLMSLTLNKTALNMTSEAILLGRKSLKIFTDLEIRWGQAYTYHALQYAHQQSGSLTEAEKCARSALQIVKGLDLPLEEGYIKCGLAEILIETGEIEQAGPLLKEAETQLEPSKLNLCRALLQYARFYQEQNKVEPAIAKGDLQVQFRLGAENENYIANQLNLNGVCEVELKCDVTDQDRDTVAQLTATYHIRRLDRKKN